MALDGVLVYDRFDMALDGVLVYNRFDMTFDDVLVYNRFDMTLDSLLYMYPVLIVVTREPRFVNSIF